MKNCTQHKQCIRNALREGEEICAKQHLRFTETRRRVLEIIWESHRPAKAYDILEKLSDGNTQTKPPTVYRALDFLLDNGMIHKINSLNAYVGCSHPSNQHQCHFLICTECDDVFECCNGTLDKAINSTADKTKFKPISSSVEIQGICHECLSGHNP